MRRSCICGGVVAHDENILGVEVRLRYSLVWLVVWYGMDGMVW